MDDLARRLRAHPENDLSLAVGGVALAIAATVAFDRMDESWAAFPALLLLAIPCAVLFAFALAPGGGGQQVGTRADGRLAAWQTAFLLLAIVLLAGTVMQLLLTLGKDDVGSGGATLILALSGLTALVASVRLDSPGATFLAALFLSAAGLAAIDWIDDEAGIAVYRDVLLAEGALLLLAARNQWADRRGHAHILVAASGAALIAGATLANVSFGGAFFPFSLEFAERDGWELVTVAVSIGLLAYAAWQRHGGSAFVGAVGLVSFLSSTTTEGSLWGWPLVLLALAAGCFAWAMGVARPKPSA